MKKNILFGLAITLGIFFLIVLTIQNNQDSKAIISSTANVETHKKNLDNSPFKNTLTLTKEERKQAGLPPNKYFEEEYELTMNPFTGRPSFENLKRIKEQIDLELQSRAPGDGVSGDWISRGPDNVGGRTRAIMFDPNDTTNETVFAGGVSGGLWKNTQISNQSSVWSRVDLPNNLNVSVITFDPNNTNIFYVGTGETYTSGDVNGDGVWKSEDAGLTWSRVLGGISGPTTFQSASNVTINSPSGIAGDYVSVPTTNFGPTITSVITGDLVLANDPNGAPTEACNAFGVDASGKIALIRRGACNFTVKVKNAQDEGAIGAIVMNNIDGDPIPMGGDDPTITIPAVMISKADGDILEAALASGTVNGSLNPQTGDFTGNLVPGIQHINDIKIKDNAGVSEIYVAAGETFYGSSNATTFMVGPEFGVYKSTDAGANWTELSLPLTANGNKHEPNDIEIGADGKIWISTITSSIYGDGGGKIFSSTDGINFADTHTVAGANRTQIAVSSQNADTIYILAQIDGGVTMKVTTDGFATATSDMALPNDADNGIPANDFTRGQAFYDLLLEVDPTNDQILYAGGIDLFKSDNAGTAWNQISKWSNNNNLANLNVPLVHADQHAMVFSSSDPNLVLFGNDGGVYYSTDGGISNSSRNVGFITSQYYTVGVAPTTAFGGDDYFVGGLQDNGTQLVADASPGINSAIETYGGDGAYSFFDQDGTDQYYIRNFVYNNGVNLHNLSTNTNVTLNSENTNVGSFINPQGLDSNLDILYSNYSSNAGTAIRRYAGIKSQGTLNKTDLTSSELASRPTAFNVSPYTTTSSTLLVGTVLGDILLIENADTSPTWTNIETSNIIVGSVSDVEFGESENEIFATIHNYGVESIWYTNDGGATWTGKEGDLPDMPVKAILKSPLNPEEVIIGTELGVWYTTNFSSSSPNWLPAFSGMTDAKVLDLDLRDDNAVYAATYGRGVFSSQFELDPTGDIDGDGVLNGIDNCVSTANPDQADSDNNGIGDACQDTDGDTILDNVDNCINTSNIDQTDTDGDGVGDACQDSDGDTIFDDVDNCINTANTDQTDTNNNGSGDVCDTSYEDVNNISLEVISETCEDQDNGTLHISVVETYVTYTVTVVGSGVNLTDSITTSNTLTIENLPVGPYTVCVSVDGRDYEQCYEINIDEASSLDGIFSLANNPDNNDSEHQITSVNIASGTPPFVVSFNDEIISITSESSFEIETNGSGVLKIESSKACEGTMQKFIEATEVIELRAFPNPVVNTLQIILPNTEIQNINVEVYEINGKRVFNNTLQIQNSNTLQVPFSNLSKGIYFVKVNLNTPQILRIIKQ